MGGYLPSQFYHFLYAIDPRLTWPGTLVLVILAAAAALNAAPLGPASRRVKWLTTCGVIAIFAIVAGEFAFSVGYLFYPSYLDHAEAYVAAVSWLGWEGYPLYPRLDIGDVYGLPYGPFLYQINGFFLWLLGPSIATSKVLGLLAFGASQVLSYVTLRRAGAAAGEALVLTGVQCVILARSTNQAYVSGVRADVLLLLIGQIAILSALARPTLIGAAAVGLLGGIAMNLKIHAPLYVVPAFVYCLARSPSPALGIRLIGAALTAGIAGLVLPFLPANVSVKEYIGYFQLLVHHQPWLRWLFEKNIIFVLMCLAPFSWVYACFAPKLENAYWWFLATLGACMLLTSIPAAESGAGPHHLLPYLPSLLWGLFVMRRAAYANPRNGLVQASYERVTLGLIAALVVGYGPLVFISWGRVLDTFADTPLINKGIAEIDQALSDNPGLKIAVGPGGPSFNDAERLRVIPVFHGNPLPIDPSAWTNFKTQGVSDEVIKRAIDECRVNLWLLPANAAFSDESVYTPDVRATFHENYRLQQSGQIFDQWRCRRG